MLAEHDDDNLNSVTLNAINAASKLGDVSVLVAGANAKKVAEQVLRIRLFFIISFFTALISYDCIDRHFLSCGAQISRLP